MQMQARGIISGGPDDSWVVCDPTWLAVPGNTCYATVDYIGEDSSNQQVVKVHADGPGVDFIRKGMSGPTAEAAKSSESPKD